MIRDPSDGTVREAPKVDVGIPRSTPGPDTGIRQPTRTDAQVRLERSREWLKDYHERNAAHARGNDGKELPTSGHSIQVQRETESSASARSSVD
jgi:hypothetical protein